MSLSGRLPARPVLEERPYNEEDRSRCRFLIIGGKPGATDDAAFLLVTGLQKVALVETGRNNPLQINKGAIFQKLFTATESGKHSIGPEVLADLPITGSPLATMDRQTCKA